MSTKSYIQYKNSKGAIEHLPIGLGLRLIRKSKKLTIKEVSKIIGVHRNTVSNYEHGKTRIPASVFMRLMKLYVVNIEIIHKD